MKFAGNKKARDDFGETIGTALDAVRALGGCVLDADAGYHQLLEEDGDLRRALESLPVEGFAVEISRVKKSGLDVCDFSVVLDAAHENHDHDMAYLHGQGGASEHGHDHDHGHAHDHDHAHGAPGGHHHRGPAEIAQIIDGAAMADGAKAIAHRMFGFVADAEARAHGVPVGEVHFHEVRPVADILNDLWEGGRQRIAALNELC